jgi:hypothetical protein
MPYNTTKVGLDNGALSCYLPGEAAQECGISDGDRLSRWMLPNGAILLIPDDVDLDDILAADN